MAYLPRLPNLATPGLAVQVTVALHLQVLRPHQLLLLLLAVPRLSQAVEAHLLVATLASRSLVDGPAVTPAIRILRHAGAVILAIQADNSTRALAAKLSKRQAVVFHSLRADASDACVFDVVSYQIGLPTQRQMS